jgi:hypothetical protein
MEDAPRAQRGWPTRRFPARALRANQIHAELVPSLHSLKSSRGATMFGSSRTVSYGFAPTLDRSESDPKPTAHVPGFRTRA